VRLRDTGSQAREAERAMLVNALAIASDRAAEIDVLRVHRSGGSPRRGLVCPIQVPVRDDLVRRRRLPISLVFRLRIAD
jgi:hypothetical protein